MLQAHFRYVIKFKNFTFTLSFAKKMQFISQTQVDELTSGVLVREDPAPLPEDITLSTECKNFEIISIFEQVPNLIRLNRVQHIETLFDFNTKMPIYMFTLMPNCMSSINFFLNITNEEKKCSTHYYSFSTNLFLPSLTLKVFL